MHEEGWEMSKVVSNVVKRKVGEINLGQLSRKRLQTSNSLDRLLKQWYISTETLYVYHINLGSC